MRIEELGLKYINLLEKIGSTNNITFTLETESIIADNCQKIVNGELICKNKHDVQHHLTANRDRAVSWSIKLHNLIPCNKSHICVVQYDITAKKLGIFIVSSILKFNNKGHVEVIDEVFHQK